MTKEPLVKTHVPGPKSERILEKILKYESLGYGLKIGLFGAGIKQLAPVMKESEGVYLIDVDGNKYMDLCAGLACAILGYRPKKVLEAIKRQYDILAHVPDMPNIPRAELEQVLVEEVAPGALKKKSRIMFDVGGGPTMDLAVRLAYFYNTTSRKCSRNAILTFFGAYQGRTIATNWLCGSAKQTENMPTGPYAVRVPYAYCYRCFYELEYPKCKMYCAKFIEKLFESEQTGWYNSESKISQITMLVSEPIPSHAGIIVPPDEFYPQLRKICDKYGLVWIDDNINTLAYTGKWFYCEHVGVTPDIIGIAKGLTAGTWPLGAVIAREELYEEWDKEPGRHLFSYMGNPVGCTAALACIRTIQEEKILSHAETVGQYFLKGLRELQNNHDIVGHVNGKGLQLSLEYVKDRETKEPAIEENGEITRQALKRGLIILGGLGWFGNRNTMHPPLTITKEEVDTSLGILDASISAAEKKMRN